MVPPSAYLAAAGELYIHRFVLGWRTLGHEKHLGAHIVNYADDFVICCRGTADEAMRATRSMMSQLRLTVNEAKARICRLPEEGVNFLGYAIGRCHSPRTGLSYIGMKPLAKKIEALRAETHELAGRRWLWTTVEDRVVKLNQKLLGRSNCFCLGPVGTAYRAVDRHAGMGSASGFGGSTSCKAAGRPNSPTRGCMTNSVSTA